jgi:hypothetical protein
MTLASKPRTGFTRQVNRAESRPLDRAARVATRRGCAMTRYGLCLFLAAAAVPLQAAPVTPASLVQPSADSAKERETLRQLSLCLARTKPRWARETLAQPYLSKDQADQAAKALVGTDRCNRGHTTAVTFRTSTLVGSLAEYFLDQDMPKTETARFETALNNVSPLNASEDFALCVAARNPAAARTLALSDPGSEAEAGAVRQLAPVLKPCFAAGEPMEIDMQALRALVSTALYRAMTSVLASRS